MILRFIVFGVITIGAFVGSNAYASTCENKTENLTDQLRQTKEICEKAAAAGISTNGLIYDPFSNPMGCFSKVKSEADACTSPEWAKQTLVERASYVFVVYEELLAHHQLDYSPRILTCKVMRESTFRPQDEASASNSSAAGLSQVTRSTAIDLFERQRWGFTPKVKGFEDVLDGQDYYERMQTSVAAQLELGLAVLHQKSIDHKATQVKTILSKYYGTDSEKENKNYAQKIYDCADCLKNNKNIITEECLLKVKD